MDGHHIENMLQQIQLFKTKKGKPKLVIANTIKGKGVSFMELNCAWHGKAPNAEELKKALEEIK